MQKQADGGVEACMMMPPPVAGRQQTRRYFSISEVRHGNKCSYLHPESACMSAQAMCPLCRRQKLGASCAFEAATGQGCAACCGFWASRATAKAGRLGRQPPPRRFFNSFLWLVIPARGAYIDHDNYLIHGPAGAFANKGKRSSSTRAHRSAVVTQRQTLHL